MIHVAFDDTRAKKNYIIFENPIYTRFYKIKISLKTQCFSYV